MNFELSDEQQAIHDIASQVLSDHCSHDRLKTLATNRDLIDRKAWDALATTGVVGASLPERYGGLGLRFLSTAVALEQVGRWASPVPLLSSTVMGALPIAALGTGSQKQRWLPGLADGSMLACVALAEDATTPSEPLTTARVHDGGYVLDGTKVLVAGGVEADIVLVPARLEDESIGVFIVRTNVDGLRITEVEVTTGQPEARFELAGVQVSSSDLLGWEPDLGERLGVDGTEVVRFIEQRAVVGQCMMMAGAARAAIEMAADYTKQRHQFDRPIATFQAVSQRAGDSYIDTEAMWLTAYQAAWRLSAGLPADREIAIAKYWAAEGGFRVMHAAVHVHGGVGVDRDYPLHRHFLAARQIELTLGHAEEQLTELGHLIAST